VLPRVGFNGFSSVQEFRNFVIKGALGNGEVRRQRGGKSLGLKASTGQKERNYEAKQVRWFIKIEESLKVGGVDDATP
jgi:hypothetical protein